MTWQMIVCIMVGILAIVVLRPWRFWWSRRVCPQCKSVLPRWDFWGWKEAWTCSHCGCQISG